MVLYIARELVLEMVSVTTMAIVAMVLVNIFLIVSMIVNEVVAQGVQRLQNV